MKIKGYRFTCERPFFVYFKRHYCPICGQILLRKKVSKVVHSDSEEAKDYNFEIADNYVKGNVRFSHIEFFCPACQKYYTVKEAKDNHF